MKKILNTILSLILILNYITPSFVYSANSKSGLVDNKLVENIRKGKKVSITQTLADIDETNGRYVVFINKNSNEKAQKKIMQFGGVKSTEDDKVYGSVKAMPLDISYMNQTDREGFLAKVDKLSGVVAVVQSQKRELSALPTIDDPLYPNDLTYNSAKQWNLSQPSGSYKGIDLYRAWEYIDGLGGDYGGNSLTLVAIIDTGIAYENYSKYDQYNKMVTPVPWVFSKASDLTDTIFSFGDETANNGIDDDASAELDFCLDKNSNGDCDLGEYSNYIDDKNGFNVVDWGKYWSRVTYDELQASSVCENEPYLSDGVKCVSTFSNESLCENDGLENYQYLGCYESDMGHPNDTHGHGTFISNIISAKVGNATGGIGIAPGVEILPIRIFGESYNSYRNDWVYDSAYGDQIVAAVNYARTFDADIINLSFAGSSVDYYEKIALDDAYEDGILLIAASGNENSSTTMYPAGYTSVMSVGASTKTGGRASYSSYGSTLDISAPVDNGIINQGLWNTNTNQAVNKACTWNTSYRCINGDPTASPSIFSTFANVTASGTSFAAPQAVGVAALVMTKHNNLTAPDIRYILEMTSLPNGSAGYSSTIGHGVLNAYNAVRAVDYRGKSIDRVKRLYQSVITSTGYMQTRFSDTYGARWSNWITSGNVKSVGYQRTVVLNESTGVVVQMMKGTNNGIYSRVANNFGYIGADDSQWSSWSLIGYTYGGFTTTKVGNSLVASWKSTNGKIYTRKTDDGTTWGATNSSTQSILGGVSMIYDSDNSKILQVVRSSDNYLYVRTSSDSGSTWSAWAKSLDYSLSDPTLLFANGRIIRAVRGNDNIIITRFSQDGGTTWSARNRTYGASGLTNYGVSLNYIESSNVILQTYRANNGKIYTRRSTDVGNTWSTQSEGQPLPSNLTAYTNVSTAISEATINQMVKASNGYLYYRKSNDSGLTWGNWRNAGSMIVNGNTSLFFDQHIDRIYVTTRGTDNRLYSRYSDNRGSSYSSWSSSNSIIGGASNTFGQMKVLELSNL